MQLSLLLLLATGCQTVEENDSWEAADSSYSSSGASGSEGQPLRLTAEQAQARDLIEGEKACQGHSSRACGGGGGWGWNYEICDGRDNDGDRQIDEGLPDSDRDGICDGRDTETCDGVDNDGDRRIDEGMSDVDRDGICDARDTETCDGVDNDGDRLIDEGMTDTDRDGICDARDTETCDGVDNDGDRLIDEGMTDTDRDGICDARDTETCDGLDNDGDRSIDEGFDSDADGTADCFDTEVCDGVDNDGDRSVDEGTPDTDGDGLCDARDTESCDGLDNDGDGSTDEGFDSDADGTADCFDSEDCDGVDNDGDGVVDNDTVDTDGDGTCDARDTESCDGLDNDGDGSTDEGFDSDADGTADCFDSEDCDGVDNDGDGVVDNDTVDTDGDGTCDDRDCVTLFQAEAMGWLTWTSAEGGDAVLIENSGDDDVCIDDQALYNSNLTQPFMVDEANLDNVLSPGDSLSIYYGSWAMPNGVYQPFYGSEAWWCVNISTPYMEGEVFEFLGEGLPEAIRHLANDSTDEDNDGREDHTDWSTGNGNVQTQMNIWAYQRSHSSLTAGKIAAASGSEVEVILTSQNIGRVAGSGVLTDSIPAGWTVTSVPAGCSLLGSSLSCNVSLAGAGTTFARRQFVYTIRPDSGLDTPYLELAEAMIDYSDGSSAQTSWSLPAAVYEADTDGSGSYAHP